MARTLIDLVDDVMQRPFVWGHVDCSTAVADVFAAHTGIDLLAPWRGAYQTQIEAARIVARLGGPLAALDEMARRAGLVPGAKVGAIGISGRTLCICIAPDMWAAKTQTGLAILGTVERAYHAQIAPADNGSGGGGVSSRSSAG